MPYINVNDVYILDNTGKQVDDAVDYAIANSNRNLLDNPWFTVNQRGVANGVNVNGNNYIADRWQATGTTGATRNSDGSITITDTIFQKIPTDRELDWKTVTLSVLYADGTVDKNTFIWGGTSTRYFTYGRATVYGAAYQINFNGFTKNVRAVKLELGSYSTLANDVPPDYGEELLKCQRYFYRMNGAGNYSAYGLAIASTAEYASMFVALPTVMRTTPTISRGGTFQLRVFSTGDTRGITNLIVDTIAGNTAKLSIYASALTVGWVAQLRNAGTPGYIDFSADL